MKVVRNVPNLCSQTSRDRDTKTLLYQGNINPGRGLEVAIKGMSFLPDYRLKIIGNGIGLNKLKLLSESEGVSNQVEFLGRLPFEDLKKHTESASIGILFEEPLGLSFEYSLPNKLFDYIHAETPVIASPLIEVKKIVEKYKVGELLVDRNPEHIAQQIQAMESKLSTYEFVKAKAELNWKNEEKVLEGVFTVFQDKVKN
jgi:glycosyltransferase involved in cell wall biosynthesis